MILKYLKSLFFSESVTDLIKFVDENPNKCNTDSTYWTIADVWRFRIDDGAFLLLVSSASKANIDMKFLDRYRVWRCYGRWNRNLIKLQVELTQAEKNLELLKEIRKLQQTIEGAEMLKEAFGESK